MSISITKYSREELGENQALFSGSTFMQTLFWAGLKEEYGFKPLYFVIESGNVKEGLLLLVRPIFKGISLAYIPHGPSENLLKTVTLSSLSKKLKKHIPKNTIMLRYDLLITEVSESLRGLKKSSVDIQVPDTTILNISANEDEILSGMHKKTRYNIKLAGKKGVVVNEVPISDFDRWYDIYEVTAKRDSIAIHSKEYYLSVYNRAIESEGLEMKLLYAEHEGDLLAGIFVLICGDRATYLYGASSNIKRNLMPAYLLQWEAIKLSKELGATAYDFFGIPPTDDKNHPMHGLYRFKTGFGGNSIHRVGCYDYSLSPISKLFNIAERMRNFYYMKLKKS